MSTRTSLVPRAARRPLCAVAALGALVGLGLAPGAPSVLSGSIAFAGPNLQPSLQQGRSAGVQPRSTARDGDDDTGQGRDSRTTLGGTRPIVDNPFGTPAETQQMIWFDTADADSNRWISYREAKASMGFDAPRYRIFDGDNDGRMTFDEYSEFVKREANAGRAMTVPTRPEMTGPPPVRDAEQLRAAYDVDLDGSISRLELDRILLDYDPRVRRRPMAVESSADEGSAFSPNIVMTRLDTNGDELLDIRELDRLANFLMPHAIGVRPTGPTPKPNARTVNDLFGDVIDLGDAHPPRIAGPVSLFRRLDVNNDGFIDLGDLQRLEGRAFATVRLSSVLHTLDLDYDGLLSRDEFLQSMTPPR